MAAAENGRFRSPETEVHQMSVPLDQHQIEIQRNREFWENKPLLRSLYAGFYQRILTRIDQTIAGQIVEIGSGIGNLKEQLPQAISTDLFPNPWLDLVCDGYELPFSDNSISHLILFDVFHHLEAPNAFLKEAKRALVPNGRVIIFDPYISLASYPAYGIVHHEPVAMGKEINMRDKFPSPRDYYAAQGNATRLFFRKAWSNWPNGWNVFHAEAFASFSYLFSGGFSKPALYPESLAEPLGRLDRFFSRWPRLFGARCLVGLTPS